MAYRGDSIVCFVDFGKRSNGRVPIIFTLNGAQKYKASMEYEKGKKELYPFIGMGHKGIRVLGKVCSDLSDADETTSESQAVVRLKESIDGQVLALQQKITDISDVIVFSSHTHALREAPSGPAAWNSKGLQIEGWMLTYIGQELCKTCKFERNEFHGAKYKRPFSEDSPRIEVLIKDGGERRDVVAGVVRAQHNLHQSAGEVDDTIGYFARDGRIRNSSEKRLTGATEIREGKMAYQGDLIGCAVEFAKFKDGKVPVVFTLNGEVIYEATMKYERGALELYPFIGMGHKDIRVLAKVCSGRIDEGNARNAVANSSISSANMNEATTAELQNLRQGIGEVIEERHKQIQTIVGEQQKQINDVNNSLNEILKILQGMKSKSPSENGSDTD